MGTGAAEDDDPMNRLNVEMEETPTRVSGRGAKRQRYYRNMAKEKIVYTTMPEFAPEEDPPEGLERTIALLILDRKTIWLALEDVEWAVRFL